MVVVVQRVKAATCNVDGRTVSEIGPGLLAFVGVAESDTEADVRKAACKLAGLRIFEREDGRMGLSAEDIGGAFLIVSNFTLLGRVRRGFRPDCLLAARPEKAEPFYDLFCATVAEQTQAPVKKGVFRADMQIRADLDGPFNIVFRTEDLEGPR
ncbi:MAG: D-tyrosyl-tRNA(Tyr) deacylase [Clostridia bacterium]|nr:D-tyrosyl-tRNA(Tyr) deacylase [Clostridia bacterium]